MVARSDVLCWLKLRLLLLVLSALTVSGSASQTGQAQAGSTRFKVQRPGTRGAAAANMYSWLTVSGNSVQEPVSRRVSVVLASVHAHKHRSK